MESGGLYRNNVIVFAAHRFPIQTNPIPIPSVVWGATTIPPEGSRGARLGVAGDLEVVASLGRIRGGADPEEAPDGLRRPQGMEGRPAAPEGGVGVQ